MIFACTYSVAEAHRYCRATPIKPGVPVISGAALTLPSAGMCNVSRGNS